MWIFSSVKTLVVAGLVVYGCFSQALEPVAVGSNVAAAGSITAISAIESQDGQDLNGDGDTNDRVLLIHDQATGILTNSGVVITGNDIATDGETVVFLRSERIDYVDRNGNGRPTDTVLAYYQIASAQLFFTSVVPYTAGSLPDFSVGGEHILFVSRENSFSPDYNGDGDTNDTVIRYWDMNSNQAYNTPLASAWGVVEDGVIATRIYETANLDANSNGLANEVVYVTYDIATTQINAILAVPPFNLTNVGAYPALDDGNYYFRARESQTNSDLNGDGTISSQTQALMRSNLSTSDIAWTGVQDTSGRIQARGDLIAYESSENAVGVDVNEDGDLRHDFIHVVRNLSDGSEDYFIDRGRVSLGSDVLAYALWEHYTGDVNNDGDTQDTIVFTRSLVTNAGQCHGDDVHCRFQRFIADIQAMDTISQADRNTLAGYVQHADDVLTQGGFASDVDLYVAVIDAFDVFFDSIWGMAGVPHEDKMYLVENHTDGRGLKDHIHDLKDAAAAELEASQQTNQSGGNDVNPQMLIANMAVAVQGSTAPVATKQLLMIEINGIIVIAQAVMSGAADPAVEMPNLMAHIQAMQNILSDPGSGLSPQDVDAISAALGDFMAMLSGGN